MSRLHLGFALAQEPSSGGVYQYSEAMRNALNDLAAEGRMEPATFLHRTAFGSLNDSNKRSVPIEPPSLGRVVRRLTRGLPPAVFERVRRIRVDDADAAGNPMVDRRSQRWLRRQRLDLLLFPAPDRLSFEAGIPSIMAIHDLQHRLQPHFPEVSSVGQLAVREHIYRNAARHALLLLVDSDVGREDVLNLYSDHGATEERVEVLPFVPAPGLDLDISAEQVDRVIARYGLPKRFLLYPAQFWPHKNHKRLIEAVARVQNLDVHLVLCGSASGSLRESTFAEAMRLVSTLGIDDRVHYLGYVSDIDLSALYARAVALVFPTFFGPSNIPVIEAWNFGLPVITSRIRGIVEQVGDAGLLVDPGSVEDMAVGIERVCTDEGLRRQLCKAGQTKLDLYDLQDHRRRLLEILTKGAEILPTPVGL